MNLSEYYNLNINGHKDIDFIDIPIDKDINLYLDPSRICDSSSELSHISNLTVKSYFDKLFEECTNNNIYNLNSLFIHVGERNETHLGISKSKPQGNGASQDILLSIFKPLIQQGIFENKKMNSPALIPIFAKSFGEDRMSDFLTNILSKILAEWTVVQCEKWSIQTKSKCELYYWNNQSLSWNSREYVLPSDYFGNPVLLVPKHFVSTKYRYNTAYYIRHYLLNYLQKKSLDEHDELCNERIMKNGKIKLFPPTKEDLKKSKLKGNSKDQARQFSIENPATIEYLELEIHKYYCDFPTLSDSFLDDFLYEKKQAL